MSDQSFAARLERLQPTAPELSEDAAPKPQKEPKSLLHILAAMLLMWGGFFLIFGLIYFLGTLGVPSKPTRWMLEAGLDGIAIGTLLFAAFLAIFCTLMSMATSTTARAERAAIPICN